MKTSKQQCDAITGGGKQCKRKAIKNDQYCWQHKLLSVKQERMTEMTTNNKKPYFSSGENHDFAHLQLSQAMETYRLQLSLLVTIITILIVANASIVGYAISTQIASVIFVGVIFPIAIFLVSRIIFHLTLPPIYTAISLESKYGDEVDIDWLASTFISVSVSPKYFEDLLNISLMEKRSERIEKLRKLGRPSFTSSGKGFIKFALVLIILGQLILPLILAQYFGWRLF